MIERPTSDLDGTNFRDRPEAAARALIPVDRHILESVVTNARDAVIVTDAAPIDGDGPRIVFVNDAFANMTGYSTPEAVGGTPRMLQGPGTSPESRRRIRAALAAWKPIEIEVLNYRKNGTEFWAELSIFPVSDTNGYFTHWVSIQRDITDRKRVEEALARLHLAEARATALALEIEHRRSMETQLAYAASHDELTGLRNRTYLLQRLRESIDAATRDAGTVSQHAFSVLFIDLDHFKIVNDSLGHSWGDALLRHVAARLTDATRAADTLARIGGDEFVIVLERSSIETAAYVAERIVRAFAAPIDVDGRNIVASPSIGIAVWHLDHMTPETLMRDADTAMYRAKQAGGNRYVAFAESMHDLAVATLQTQTDLRLALDRGEFRLQYQPIVDAVGGRMHGFEALLRWNHPTRGCVGPNEFIRLAEDVGLIVPVGAWVLREACETAKAWHDRADIEFTMSVNVSSRELLEPRFVDSLRETLRVCSLDPGTLVLEITESVFLVEEAAVRPILADIRALGVSLALDDFGTGYSSLNYLDRFDIDVLKIDRSFVSGVAEPTSKRQIVRTIVALAETLGIGVVAEGVEDASQRDALLQMGCRTMQGYLFSRPLDESEALFFLKSGRGPD